MAVASRVWGLFQRPHLFIFLATEALFLWMATSHPDELVNPGGGLAFVYIAVLCSLQILILIVLRRLFSERGPIFNLIPRAALSAMFIFNFHTVVLVHMTQEVALFDFKELILIVPGALLLLPLTKTAWKVVNIAIVAFGGTIGAQFLFVSLAPAIEYSSIEGKFKPGTFTQHPNVYFVSFDAMVPADIARYFLDLPPPVYLQYLKDQDFREVKTTFAPSVPTRQSINAIASVDMTYCDELGDDCYGLARGVYPSPLYALFKSNGYSTSFAYRTNYFGNTAGPYVDRYVIQNPLTICDHIDNNWSFLGFCFFETYDYLGLIPSTTGENRSVQAVISAGQKQGPEFVMAYVFSPGHTRHEYDTYNADDYLEYVNFFKKSQHKTVRYLELLLQTIKARDPNSIIIIFGDHGSWLTRTWTTKQGAVDPAGKVWTDHLVVLERNRVALFVYPKDFCADGFTEPYTLNRLARSVGTCLSDGQDPFVGEHSDGGRDWSRYVLPP